MTLSDWSDLGAAVGGFATAALVVVGFAVGLPGVKAWHAKLRAQKERADEQTKQIRLDRRRNIEGWSPGIVNSWEVAVVTDPAEIAQAEAELTGQGGYSAYVLLRASDGNHALNLREVAKRDGYPAREPNSGEREALDAGFAALGVPTARRAHRPEAS